MKRVRQTLMLLGAIIIGAMIFSSCEDDFTEIPNDNNLDDVVVETDGLRDISLQFPHYFEAIPNCPTILFYCDSLHLIKDTVLVINSNEELQRIFSMAPNFDFTNKSILITGGMALGGAYDLKAQLEQDSVLGYILVIKLLQTNALGTVPWGRVFETSEKIDSNTPIILEIEYTEDYEEFYENE